MNRYLATLDSLRRECLRPRQPGAPTVISVFAGAGGSSVGYTAAGFDERLAIDHDKLAVATFSLNFPAVPVWCEDIRRVSTEDVLSVTRLSRGELDVLDSSPPCQCYSRTRTRRTQTGDERSELWREVERFVVGLQPKMFVLENVPGLLDWRNVPFLDAMRLAFRAAGYRVAVRELDASRYGVPQIRRRLFLLGIRNDLELMPSYPPPDPPEVPTPTVQDAFEGLPDWQARLKPLGKLAMIVPMIPQGRDGGDVHPDKHYFNSQRLAWDAPAKTILASQLPHNILTLHPDLDCGCSVREGARLQGFMDEFILVGTHQERWRVVGNSVSPLLMWRLASHLAGCLEKVKRRRPPVTLFRLDPDEGARAKASVVGNGHSPLVDIPTEARKVQMTGTNGRPDQPTETSDVKIQLFQGDCLARLRQLPDKSAHCCVTSPPYWQKRAYSTAPQIWDGDPECQHEWSESIKAPTKLANGGNTNDKYGGGQVDPTKVYASTAAVASGQTCHRCRGWRGELGHESTPDDYVRHIVQICREIYRVLRDDGTFWLNISDTFIRNGSGRTGRNDGHRRSAWGRFGNGRFVEKHAGGERKQVRMQTSLAPGNLAGIPWRTAFALQDDGWILRSDIIWMKPSPMPESVRNRPTYSHEYVFLLSKSPRYFYDQDAIREECVSGNGTSQGLVRGKRFGGRANAGGTVSGFGHRLMVNPSNGRNARNVWQIAATPFRGAHCAPMPLGLAERCILAGTAEGGCCSGCGEPWVRSDEEPALWLPSCGCDLKAIPCTVLDPFCGAATSLLAAARAGRSGIGIELNPEYCRMGADRIEQETGFGVSGAMDIKRNGGSGGPADAAAPN